MYMQITCTIHLTPYFHELLVQYMHIHVHVACYIHVHVVVPNRLVHATQGTHTATVPVRPPLDAGSVLMTEQTIVGRSHSGRMYIHVHVHVQYMYIAFLFTYSTSICILYNYT